MAFLSFNDGLGGVVNYLLYSEQFDNAAWSKTTGVTVVPNTVAAPDGSTTGDAIAYDGSGVAGDYRIYQNAQAPLAPVASGVPFAVSVWLRADLPFTARIGNNHGNFTTCAITTTWQRFSVRGVGTGAINAALLIYSDTGANAIFTIHAWGAQAEIGWFATAYITTTSATATAACVVNDYPDTPASRFTGWTPTTKPYGDSVNTLATGATVMFRHRTDYGVSFDLAGIPIKAQVDAINRVATADRLIAHLMGGGTVSVQTDDSNATIYPTCGLAPGSSPSLRLTDSRLLLYTLSLQLINLAASPVRMDAVYAP